MYEEILRKAGLKITNPRLKILSLLHAPNNHHWSAESIRQALHDQGENISLATVYRVLTQFETHGLTKRHFFENDTSIFELTESEHHDHLICVNCGAIAEFVDEIIEQHQKNIANQFKFNMYDHRLTIYGKCNACQEADR